MNLLAALLFAAAPVKAPLPHPGCVTVVEFLPDPGAPESGKVVADVAARVMRERSRDRVFDRSELADFLRVRQLTIPPEHDPDEVAAVAAMTGSTHALDGIVTDFGTAESGVMAVEAEVRLVEVKSRAVVWQGVGRGVGKGLFSFGRAPLAAMAEEAVRNALEGMAFTGELPSESCGSASALKMLTSPGTTSLVVRAPPNTRLAPAVVVEYVGKAGGRETFDVSEIRKLHFNSGSFDVVPGMKDLVEELAIILESSREVALVIEGHSDSDPGSTTDGNFSLSVRRAQAVYTALVRDYKVDPARVYLKALGDTMPVAPNDSKLNKTRNRRVEFKFVTRAK